MKLQLRNAVRTVKLFNLYFLMLHSEMEKNGHCEVTVHLTCWIYCLEKN